MAMYSVWDWNRNAWRIYSSSTPVSVGDDPTPPRPTNISPIGANPDTDVKPLPSGVKFMGYDHLARGEVRRATRGLFDLSGETDTTATPWWKQPLVMFGAGAVAAWAYIRWSD